jgi:hypothetical protein
MYLTSKNIAEIAKDKGYSKSLWRLLAILAWIIFEFIGVVFGLIILGEEGGLMIYLFALLGALLGVFVVRKILDSRPNVKDNSDTLLDN